MTIATYTCYKNHITLPKQINECVNIVSTLSPDDMTVCTQDGVSTYCLYIRSSCKLCILKVDCFLLSVSHSSYDLSACGLFSLDFRFLYAVRSICP